jgi:hypothetical protein
VQKYSQTIDRESAYEILGRKVSELEKNVAGEAVGNSRDNGRRAENAGPQYHETPKVYGGRNSKTPQDQMVKVLTSATFIRGVFGILKKVIK